MAPGVTISSAILGWQLAITARNPVLGEGTLFHAVPLGDPQKINLHVRPQEDVVRAAVADGIRLLRGLAKSKLAGSDGHSGLVLPR